MSPKGKRRHGTKTTASIRNSRKPVAHTRKLSRPPWSWIAVIVIALLAASAAVFYLTSRNQAAGSLPDEISVAEAYQKYQSGSFFLDVRSQEEWKAYHIPGSTLIPLGELESRLDEVPRGQEIVVVCGSGIRSQTGRDILRKAGIQPTYCMTGGLKEWQAAGYPTVAGS